MCVCASLRAGGAPLPFVQNSAFNNRTKEELKMHMFKKCASPTRPTPRFGNFIWTVALALDKKSQAEEKEPGTRTHFLMFDFIYLFIFYFLIISIPQGAAKKVLQKQNRKD